MNLRNYIYLDNEIVDGNKPALMVSNSMFQLGAGTYEDIIAFGTEARHLSRHIEHLKNNLDILNIETPLILFDEKNIATLITRLLNKNRFFNNAQVRITVYMGKEPAEPSICIETHDLSIKGYLYNTNGLILDVFESFKKPIHLLSTINGSERFLNLKANHFIKHTGIDNCIILNTENRVTEVVDSNIFIVKGNKIYTPSHAEGCTSGVMRNLICQIAPTIGIDIDNQVGFNINAVLSAREVFIADSINGIRWVIGLQQQRYYNNVSKKILDEINRQTFNLH